MKPGKITEPVLERSVFKVLQFHNKDMVKPSFGTDYAFWQEKGSNYICSMDPVIGDLDAGRRAVIVAANNIATAGASPVGIMISILMPETMKEKELKKLMKSIDEVCEETNLVILGGHTETNAAVSKLVVTVTAIGKVDANKRITSKGAVPGQDIVMTKYAGMEGTALLAKDKKSELLSRYSNDFIDMAATLSDELLIINEARIGAEQKVSAMHDLHQGGIYGGLWEIAAASKVGLKVILEDIPMKQETVEISEFYDLNPYKLLSGGSLLMVTDHGRELVELLEEAGIPAAIIGKTTKDAGCIIVREGEEGFLEPPKSDEIYRI